MPYLQKDAPDHIPEEEWIESLLCDRIDGGIKPFQDLTEDERQQTNLVQIGKRTERIQGDPYGLWCSWAGNDNHQRDPAKARTAFSSAFCLDELTFPATARRPQPNF
jgi:hypothetical protein